jgi:membrane-bound metal-dependent hydrolase YbcI (DUF457 family)
MLGLVALALLPDIDFIAFHFGIPYRHPFGHRGAAHSPAFALLVGALVAATLRAFGRPPQFGGAQRPGAVDAAGWKMSEGAVP